jgi:hypothetical protein
MSSMYRGLQRSKDAATRRRVERAAYDRAFKAPEASLSGNELTAAIYRVQSSRRTPGSANQLRLEALVAEARRRHAAANARVIAE